MVSTHGFSKILLAYPPTIPNYNRITLKECMRYDQKLWDVSQEAYERGMTSHQFQIDDCRRSVLLFMGRVWENLACVWGFGLFGWLSGFGFLAFGWLSFGSRLVVAQKSISA